MSRTGTGGPKALASRTRTCHVAVIGTWHASSRSSVPYGFQVQGRLPRRRGEVPYDSVIIDVHVHLGAAGVHSQLFGNVALIDAGGRPAGTTCEQAVLDRALTQVTEIAERDRRAEAGHDTLTDTLHTLAARISPRTRIGLIHGELGPDHVLVEPDGTPVLIDIEGLSYFDIEREHVFTRMRFERHYNRLHRDDLDQHRLNLYQLAMHIDLVAGPLRIAESDHPERQWFLDLADSHLQQALEFQP